MTNMERDREQNQQFKIERKWKREEKIAEQRERGLKTKSQTYKKGVVRCTKDKERVTESSLDWKAVV